MGPFPAHPRQDPFDVNNRGGGDSDEAANVNPLTRNNGLLPGHDSRMVVEEIGRDDAGAQDPHEDQGGEDPKDYPPPPVTARLIKP